MNVKGHRKIHHVAIHKLISRGQLPRHVCIICGNAETKAFAVHVQLEDEIVILPISTCQSCCRSRVLLEPNSVAFNVLGGLTAMTAIAISSPVTAGLSWLVGLVAVAFFILGGIWKEHWRNKFRQTLLADSTYRTLFDDDIDSGIRLEGGLRPFEPEDDSYRDSLFIMTPTDSRINSREFQSFVALFVKAVESYFEQLPITNGFDCQVACALLPGGRQVLEIQTSSDRCLSQTSKAELLEGLRCLPQPGVTEPVAFAARSRVLGGADFRVEPDVPFASLLPENAESSMDDILLQLGMSQAATKSVATPWASADYTRLLDLDSTNVSALVGRAELFFSDGKLDEALRDLGLAIEAAPTDADLYATRGNFYVHSEAHEKAFADYDKALEIDSDHVWTRTNRAMLRLQRDETDQALEDIEHALSVAPKDPQLSVSRGLIHAARGDLDRAITDFTLAIFRQPEYAEAYFERAKINLQREDTVRALTDLTATILHAPQSGVACALRASVYLTDGEFDKAAADLSTAIERDPDEVDYRLQRAQVYAQQGKHSLAIEDYTELLDRDPEFAVAQGLRGISHQELDDFEDAIEDCSEAIGRGFKFPQVHFSRAVAYHFTDETDQALLDLEKTLELEPNHAPAFNVRGLIRLADQCYDEALEDFAAAITNAPDWALPYFHRGNLHAEQGLIQQAIRDYDEAIRLQPEFAIVHKNRGTAHAELGKDDQAIEDFGEAIRQDGELVPAYYERAALRYNKQDYEGAVEDLDQVLRFDSEFAPAYLMRANAWRVRGDHDRALLDLDMLVDLCPTLGAAYSARGSLWIEIGEHEKAREDFAEAIRQEPSSAESFTLQRLLVEAAHFHNNEDFKQAISKSCEAIEFDPECQSALSLRAVSYWYSEHYVEAIDDFTQLIELESDPTEILGSRGQVYTEMGEFELALLDLDRVLESSNVDEAGRPYVLSGRALALVGLGRFKEADKDFEASIVACPENSWVHYNHGLTYHQLEQNDKAAVCFELALSLDQPGLTPLKRRRAKAFLQSHAVSFGDE